MDKKHKTAIILLIVVVMFFFWLIIPHGDTSTKQESDVTVSNQNSSNSKDFKKLDGFELSSNVAKDIYGYRTTEDEQAYSVSLGIGQSLLSAHKKNYPLKRDVMAVDSVDAIFGYNEALMVNGQLVQPEFSSLAFDYIANGTPYAGEITNLSNATSQNQLLAVMKRFITAAINK